MNFQLAKAIARFVADPTPLRAQALQHFPRRQWRRAEFWLHTAGLALYLLHCLRQAGMEDVLPAGLRSTLNRNLRENEARVADRWAEFQLLLRAFADTGIAFACDKGFTLSPEYCPDQRLRVSFDFDFIVPRGCVPVFESALHILGYTTVSRGEENGFEMRPGFVPEFRDLYQPRRDYRVELHTDMIRRDRGFFQFASLEGMIGHADHKTWSGVSFPSLAPVEMLVRQAVHLLTHATDGWFRLAWLLEFQRGLAATVLGPRFEEQLRAIAACDAGYGQAVAFAELLAAKVLGMPLEPSTAWAREGVPEGVRRWIRECGPAFALSAYPGSMLDLLLLREVLGPGRQWRSIRRQRLFPVKRPRRVAMASGRGVRQHVHAWRAQSRFLWSRIAFHIREALRYSAYSCRWSLRRERSPGGRVVNSRPCSTTPGWCSRR